MDFSSLLSTATTLFLLIIVGYVAKKANMIDDVATKKLSLLILKIGQPFMIINSLIRAEYSKENLYSGLEIVGISLLVHIILIVFSMIFTFKIKDENIQKVNRLALVFNNCGFFGFPILASLFGPIGVFKGAFYNISYQILLWSWGIFLYQKNRPDIKLNLKKVLINYGTVPCAIGLFIYMLNLPLPVFLTDTTNYISNLCTPITMLTTGALIATRPIKTMFLTVKLYVFASIKLLLIPVATIFILRALNLSTETIIFSVVMSALPSAAAVTMFSEVNDINPPYAAQVVGFTSVLSVATIPIVMYVADFILSRI